MTQSDFTWTFPCYVLARDFSRDSNSGRVTLGADSQVMAPRVTSDEPHLAIFTDDDLAESFRDEVPAAAGMQLLEFTAPIQLKAFIDSVSDRFQHAVIDLNPRTRICRIFRVDEMQPALEQWIRESS